MAEPFSTAAFFKAALPAIISLAGSLFGGGGNSGGGTSTQQMTPEMRTLFNMDLQKQRAQMPLYNNLLMMSNRMLPMWARQQHVSGMTENRAPGDPGADLRKPSPHAEDTGRKALLRF